MKSIFVILVSILFTSQIIYCQTEERNEFEKMYDRIKELDSTEYKLKIMEIVKFLDKYPEFKKAKSYLYQQMIIYKEQIKNDQDIIIATMKHFDNWSHQILDLFLVHFYKTNNEERVYEVLSRVLKAPVSPKFNITFFLDLDRNINIALYKQILTTLSPFIQYGVEPERYLQYYIEGKTIELNEILSGTTVVIPLKLLGRFDPDLNPEIYLRHFSQSLPSDPEIVIDSITDKTMLINICNQYLLTGNDDAFKYIWNKGLDQLSNINDMYRFSKSLYSCREYEQFAEIMKKIYNSISPSDTLLNNRFYWGISCLELDETYKSEQFLTHVFLYSRGSQLAYYKSELLWWASKGLNTDAIGKLMYKVFGETITAGNIPNKNNIKFGDQTPANQQPLSEDSRYGNYHALLIAVQDYDCLLYTSRCV